MNAKALASLLRQQATPAPHQILLDDATLERSGLNDLITENLQLSSGALVLTIDPETIPQNPPEEGFTLDAIVPDGTAGFLNLGSRVCTIQFIVGTDIDLVLTVQTRMESGQQSVDWTFSTSFPELAGLPYNYLNYVEPELVFASIVSGNFKVGLSFNATLQLTGLLSYVADVISASDNYTLLGQLSRDANQNLTFELQADLNVPSLNLGDIVEMKGLNVGTAYSRIKASDGSLVTLSQLYIGATVTFENSSGTKLPLDIRVAIPTKSDMPILVLQVLPTAGFETSLDRLGSLIGGETWDAFFEGPAAEIKPFFETFGLTGYSATFAVNNLSVVSSSLSVGTLQPWTMWGDYSVTLDANWTILFGSPSVSIIEVDALFSFKEIDFLVTVVLPDLTINGQQSGDPIQLSLSELNQRFYNGLTIPEGLLEVEIADFNIGIDIPNKQFNIGAFVSASVSLFGTELLAIEGMTVAIQVDASQSTLGYTANLSGVVKLGTIEIQTDATLSNQTDTVFSLHLINETLGSMLNELAHLVDPTFDVSFGDPWDKILDISLDRLILKVNVTKGIVELSYTLPDPIDLVFIKINGLSLSYTKGGTNASSTRIELDAEFFGQQFGGGGDQPALGWDPINENPPSLPSGSSSVFDLQYVGLGQHIALSGKEVTTINEVMEAMRESVLPSPAGALPPFGQNGLAFSAESNWLIGAQFSVAGTVSISAIFNDPNMYGILIQLSGEKAKSFAGLSFEILYRKVTETIGVYHIELKLPDAMRNLQFGAVSVTLPVVIIDIYTNGNFRIDLGFPKGLDFSNSFSVQIFPFVGFGGIYFALLDGATSTRVPKIKNGTFSPVIEFGFALSIGVGKTVNAGILSGGITVTVVGIVQGSLAWFNPTDTAPQETFYWIQGTVAIVGRLYANIDFVIIKASVDVTAYASVTLTIESHQPIYIAIKAEVSVRVGVKVVFFTIHLSFKATVSASFTIDSATPTPWKLAQGNDSSSDSQLQLLRGQKGLYSSRVHRAGYMRALRFSMLGDLPPITEWPAVTVLPNGVQNVTIWAMPAFTKSDVPGKVEAILILAAENSIDPRAASILDHQTVHGSDPTNATFNLLMQSMLRWGIYVKTSGGTSVTADQLAELQKQLKNPDTSDAAFDYSTLTAFLEKNFTINVRPTNLVDAEKGVAIFPMIPAITLSDTAGISVPFSSWNEVDTNYQEKIGVYFELLQTQFDDRNNSGSEEFLDTDDTKVSMSTIVFVRYFNMLMTAGVKSAVDLLASYPYTTPSDGAMSVAEVGTAIGDADLVLDPLRLVAPNQDKAVLASGAVISLPNVMHQIRSGDDLESVAAALAALGAMDQTGAAYTVEYLLEVNLDSNGIFSVGANVPVNGLGYTTQGGDTLNLISARILLRANSTQLLNQINNLAASIQSLLSLNPSITDPNQQIDAGTTINLTGSATYVTVVGDTLTLIAGTFVGMEQGIFDLASFVQELLKLNTGLSVTDPTQPQPVGTALVIPQVTRVIAAQDTVSTLAITLITTTAIIQTNLLAIPKSTPLLASQGVMKASLLYAIAEKDTFSGIAGKFNLALSDIADQITQEAEGAVPRIFATDQDLVISDLESIEVSTLMENLMCQAEWNNASGQVSRFLLSGLRLPDPNDSYFQNLTVEQLRDPTKLGDIVTAPMFGLTGQQYTIDSPPSDDYEITLENSASASWLTINSSNSDSFPLTTDQLALLNTIATTPLTPNIETLTRLALYQMVPPRIAILNHIAWQASAPPTIDQNAQGEVGNPSIWQFPDDLILKIENGTGSASATALMYELVLAKETSPDALDKTQVPSYAWGTMVNIPISLPVTDGPTTSVSNSYVIDGADDNGAALIQKVYNYLTTTGASDTATIYLLYSPNQSGGNPSGLVTDSITIDETYLIKTNLSTLTHSGNTAFNEESVETGDPTDVFAASISEVTDFLALLWEASITRSGGFFLNYVNSDGGKGLPADIFGTETSANISLLILLGSQTATENSSILPFNNCAVVGTNIDSTSSSVFAQPATYTVAEGDSFTTVQANFNSSWGTDFSVLDVAAFNQAIPLLLSVGASMTIPGQNDPYEILYGDTLAGILVKFPGVTSLESLLNAGINATAATLQAGAQMQFAQGILQPTSSSPQGTVGFEITRTNPDPENVSFDQLTPAQTVGALFNLVGFNIAAEGDFIKSGAGLPTTPADSLQDKTNGLTTQAIEASTDPNWFYHQAIVVSAFSTTQYGSLSAALPPVLSNPYNGIGFNSTTNKINEVTIDLDLQDIYGNIQTLAAPYDAQQIPVGYFDNVISPGSWPSLAISYDISGTPVTAALTMTMQQMRYIPGTAVSVASAMAAVKADLASYRKVYYQLAQPDLVFALQTSLDADSLSSVDPKYPLSKIPFLAFTNGAYVYLDALSKMKQVVITTQGTSTSVYAVGDQYGVTGAQLFTENQNALYSEIFGPALIEVPTIYQSVAGDSLQSIVANPKWGDYNLTVTVLAENNESLQLNPGIDLVTPESKVVAAKNDSLNSLSTAANASIEAVAETNQKRTDILQQGTVFTVGTQSYTLTANDSFENAASKLNASVSALAIANQWLEGIFIESTSLDVTDAVVCEGDSLKTLASTYYGGDVSTLATANETVETLFPAGTSILIGTNPIPTPAEQDDTLVTFAQLNSVTIDQLGTANETKTTVFADAAQINIPGVLLNDASDQNASYTASNSDTVTKIANKFDATVDEIVSLNPDLPGLLLTDQTITDSGSGKSVKTINDDTFQLIIERFEAQGVTVTLQQLAADVAGQDDLIASSSLWITTPMLGGANGENTDNSLSGLASVYNSDIESIAIANAATLGFLARNVELTLNGVFITTNEKETLNSLVNRLAVQGVIATVSTVAEAIKSVAGLIAKDAMVTPIPSPSPTGNSVEISPKFSDAVFQICVNVVVSRNPQWIDPDFNTVASVAKATSSIVPTPGSSKGDDSLSLTQFANDMQGAISGLHVATGDPVAEDDPSTANTIWGVNFASDAGPKITYKFSGPDTAYFAIPPLSTALMGGKVDVISYVQGQVPPFSGGPATQTFQAVDLDNWLNSFLEATDLFLTPAYVIPAYSLSPDSVTSVIDLKGDLAQYISSRLNIVLEGQSQGVIADAIDAMYQALLQKLSNAFSIDTIMQVPVTVTSSTSDEKSAPRLSGNVKMQNGSNGNGGSIPSAFSFSTSKVSLTNPSSSASFLFSVKSPADHKQANLDLEYVVNELELPTPTSVIGDYEGSSWLNFVIPLSNTDSSIGQVDIPVPLRSYPSPVTLNSQTASQSVETPQTIEDLLGWNFEFEYQHDDAQQDTPLAAVTFSTDQQQLMQLAHSDASVNISAVFQALAQFIAVYPALKNDLATLPTLTPGSPNSNALAAVEAFSWLVKNVVTAWKKAAEFVSHAPPPETFYYQLQKRETQEVNPSLDTLTITSFDPLQNKITPNPMELWPEVYIEWEGNKTKLNQVGKPTDTSATYQYPIGISANAELPQQFNFTWPDPTQTDDSYAVSSFSETSLGAGQTFNFFGTNILQRQNGQAGIIISRNLSLIHDVNTNPSFVYQTPVTNFSSTAIPVVFAGNPISIGSGASGGIAASLGAFFDELLNTLSGLSADDSINIRLGMAYTFPLATTEGDDGGSSVETLSPLVPISLIPTFEFDPGTDYKVSEANSFVNQVQAIITDWQNKSKPTLQGGSYMFDMTIYSSQGDLQPLIQVTRLQYSLSS